MDGYCDISKLCHLLRLKIERNELQAKFLTVAKSVCFRIFINIVLLSNV